METQNFNFEFPYYPSINNPKDIEMIVKSYLKKLNLTISDFKIFPMSTIYPYEVFGVKNKFLSNCLRNFNNFLYIYFDNFVFYSMENVSGMSFGLSKRSDNFVSNRSHFSAQNFLGDLEETLFLSKSLDFVYRPSQTKVVLAGDYFSNPKIQYELKLNLVLELIEKGFYEIYLDEKVEFPNFINLIQEDTLSQSYNLKCPEFFKFFYLVSSEKETEVFLKKSGQKASSLEVKKNEVSFLHSTYEKLPLIQLQYKGSEIGKGELNIDSDFKGILLDKRNYKFKKEDLALESLRKVIDSIQKNYDYSSL
jgi:hypothetical protein